LRDEELVDLIAASDGKWIFIGMESIDSANLADVNKSFNKPAEYEAVLNRLADRGIYAITSFIFGLDNDTLGVADRTLQAIESWPPGLPILGQLTPFPSTPLYQRLLKADRLTRPKHWLDFAPFHMAHTPLKMSIEEVHSELNRAWVSSYSPERNASAVEAIKDRPIGYQIMHLVTRLIFRGIYFPQMGKRAWVKLLFANRKLIYSLGREGLFGMRQVERSTPVAAGVPITES
jgi:hypothetical protein